MMEVETVFGSLALGSVGQVHCVSPITPNFHGLAIAEVAANTSKIAKTSAGKLFCLKLNPTFIPSPRMTDLLTTLQHIREGLSLVV
jgi:hypothetical protein